MSRLPLVAVALLQVEAPVGSSLMSFELVPVQGKMKMRRLPWELETMVWLPAVPADMVDKRLQESVSMVPSLMLAHLLPAPSWE